MQKQNNEVSFHFSTLTRTILYCHVVSCTVVSFCHALFLASPHGQSSACVQVSAPLVHTLFPLSAVFDLSTYALSHSPFCDWILKWHLLDTLRSNRDGSSKQPLQQTDLQLQQTFFRGHGVEYVA